MNKIFLFLLTVCCGKRLHAQEKDSLPGGDSAKFRSTTLKTVTVSGKRPPVLLLPDRTIINVDASISNTGATLLEVLEKSSGITLDRNGNISLKGRQGVTIMIDGKPAQLSGTDLNNLLSTLAAAQIDQIEIIDNPSSRYDASGNAGIINIKTKKNRQKGFNGNLNIAVGHGRYARTGNSITLNRYQGKVNLFASFTVNANQNFADLYALRKYYEPDNKTLTAILEQPSYFKGTGPSYSAKAGADYFLSKKTTLGVVFTGTAYNRKTTGNNEAVWMNAAGITDSVITTTADNRDRLRNGGINVNARHAFSDTKELTADLDYLGYKIGNSQQFTNRLDATNGYVETLTGHSPSFINIFTGKADYTQSFAKGLKLETGWKSSHVETNNRAEYFDDSGTGLRADLGKTNHFLYSENIHAAYVSLEKRSRSMSLQGGLRYENTHYNAEQLGNVVRPDSSFTRKYDGLFPTVVLGMQLDSINRLSLSAGRRIDRPPFQSLNPFVFVINKYTYQSGNPYYRPQYTWNTELTYSFKNLLVTSLSYSITKDYFSQIFLTDSTGIFYYSEGNLDRMQNIGLSVSAQASIASWWSFNAETSLNYKKISGFVWDERRTALTQLHLTVNNQFKFQKGWSAELSGFYSTRELELQEITDPTGQVTAGISKQVLKNRGAIRFLVRDIFYTQATQGNTTFKMATEYFRLTRDTRIASISLSYRFGTSDKITRQKTGGADEERKRVSPAN